MSNWIQASRRRINLQALRVFQRFIPAERQRVFALTIVVGVVCGFAAVAFHLAIMGVETLLIDRAIAAPVPYWIVLTILTPTIGAAISGVLLTYVVPDARGSGIPQVKVAYAIKGGYMPMRVAVGKFLIGVLQIGSGASLGREGPTVQICAGIASRLGRAMAISRQNQRALLPVGAAAGIAAAFNAPIAAVTFTIEEIIGDLDQTVLTGVIVAAALAAAIERMVLGTHPVLGTLTAYSWQHTTSLILYAALGIAAAFVSIAFCESLLRLRLWFQRMTIIPLWARPGVGGFVNGALVVAALLFLGVGGINGSGYPTLSSALSGNFAMQTLLLLCVMKLGATVFSYSSGGAGGIFAPSLFIGGMLGGVFGHLDIMLFHHEATETGAFALVGMGAVFAGIVRAPITSVLIIFEMTGGYGLILPLMIANMTAYALARRLRPLAIYEALLVQDGVQLPHHGRPAPDVLEHLQVGSAMSTQLVTVPGNLSVAQVIERIASLDASAFPVLDDDNQFVGLVSEARLRRTMAEDGGDLLVSEIVNRRMPLFPDQRLIDAINIMDREQSRELAVVERRRPRHLLGLLSLSDVVRAQANAAREAGMASQAPMSEVQKTLEAQPAFKRLQAFGDGGPDEQDGSALRYHTVAIGEGAPAVGKQLRDLKLPDGVLIVTVDRHDHMLVPQGGTVIQPDDQITLFADRRQLPHALEVLCGEREAKQPLS
ncbi:MAG TPA: chloride channel protein [Roseiflexaceae bacterium]|jgi:CIC family chloride channel protein|nr:chloride channel protein [Roseiflexaceae bacterium]